MIAAATARVLSRRGTALALLGVTVGLGVLWVALGEPFQLVALPLALVGVLLWARRPTNPIGPLVTVSAALFTVMEVGRAWAEDALPGGGTAAASAVWTSEYLIIAWTCLVGVLVPLLFPDGRFRSRRWRRVAVLASVSAVTATVGSVLAPGTLETSAQVVVANPLALDGTAGRLATVASQAGTLVTSGCGLVAILGVVLQLRGAHGVRRQQLLVVTAALLLLMTGLTVAGGASAVTGDAGSGPWVGVAVVGWFTFLAGLLVLLPVAIAVAVLRYRLYGVDLVVRRSLVYGPVVVVLAATYLASVLLLGVLLRPVTRESDVAVAASTLAVAALFQPVRRRVRALVDRRFFRSRYDAERTVHGFGAAARSLTDLDVLSQELVVVVRDAVQPAHVRLWLRDAPPAAAAGRSR